MGSLKIQNSEQYSGIQVGLISNRDIQPLRIFDNLIKSPDDEFSFYSTPLQIMIGVSNGINEIASTSFDKMLQLVVLTIDSDSKTDLRQFRHFSKDNRPIFPSIALSLDYFESMYTDPDNNARFETIFYDGNDQLVAFTALPVVFHFKMRYYNATLDGILRYQENLMQNSTLAFPKNGFSYSIYINDTGKTEYMNGTIKIDIPKGSYAPKPLSLDFKQMGNPWVLEVPVTAWATLMSAPYSRPMVRNTDISVTYSTLGNAPIVSKSKIINN